MKVMIDTNVLVSAIYNFAGTPALAYQKASNPPYELILCNQIIDELRSIYNKKFIMKIALMECFLAVAHYQLISILPGDSITKEEHSIRDTKDRIIMRAALKAGVDIFITGDKDFLESGVKNPRILTPSEFLNME